MLKEYNVNSVNTHPHDYDLLLNISALSFMDLEQLLNKHSMLNCNKIAIRLMENIYLDELFENDNLRTEFENFLFTLIENSHKSSRFIYIVFKIHEQDLYNLVHNGFYEWLEYWMLFFKFTKINFLIEMEEQSLTKNMPIEYVIAKRLDNPRTSLFVNSYNVDFNIIPEDLNTFVLMTKDEKMKNNFPYATMWIK